MCVSCKMTKTIQVKGWSKDSHVYTFVRQGGVQYLYVQPLINRRRKEHRYNVKVLLDLSCVFSCLDYLVQRRLEITAQYDLMCSLLDDKITRSTAQTIANSHSAGLINTICDQGLCVELTYEPCVLCVDPCFDFRLAVL